MRYKKSHEKIYLLLLVIFSGIIVYFMVDFMIGFLKKYDIRKNEDVPVKRRRIVFAVSALLCFLLMMIWYAGYYPGSFSSDSISQYGQAVTGFYRDWHPVWHTLMLIIVKEPVYYILNVEQPQSRVVEIVGMPLTIIGNVVKETPDVLDEELSEFVYSIASQESWETNYVCGDFNSIKWQESTNLGIVQDKGILTVVRLSLKCFQYSPKASFKALFALTDMVYGLENDIEDFGHDIAENDYGINYMGNGNIADFLQCYRDFMTQTIFKYFRNIGFSMFLMLLAMLAWSDLKLWEDWKKLFLCIPVFTYNFGTMLLLTGPDSRFFYISFLVCPLVIIMAMVKRRNIQDD